MKVSILNSVHCKVSDGETYAKLLPLLSYEHIGRKMDPRGFPAEYSKRVPLLTKKGLFLTGLLPLVKERFPDIEIEGEEWKLEMPKLATLPGITYKKFQKEAIQTALHLQRGVLKLPARSGKTIIGAAVIKSFNKPSFFIVNTKDILQQTVEEFERFGLNPGQLGAGKKDIDKDHIVATFHSLREYVNDIDFLMRAEIVIIDECHHARTVKGSYWNILHYCFAPVRIGLTATIPDNTGEKMIMEGLIGPKIFEITQEEAERVGSVVKAKVKIIKAPPSAIHIKALSYQTAYEEGVIKNRSLNRTIAIEAKNWIDRGNSVLILVSRVQHGFEIERIFNLLYPQYNVPFLCGGIDSDTADYMKFLQRRKEQLGEGAKAEEEIRDIDEKILTIEKIKREIRRRSQNRNQYRHDFIDKKIPCVIATNIWNEGVNIPSLNVLFNAAGGRSEIRAIQSASRSLTACEGKEEGVIIDIFNPLHRSFVDHFGHRVSIYCDLGWM